jgi:Ras-related protein Rab-5C
VNYLIGNKLDVVEESPDQRAVEYEDAQAYAQENGFMLAEVSCTKRKNIEMVLKMVKNRVAKHV